MALMRNIDLLGSVWRSSSLLWRGERPSHAKVRSAGLSGRSVDHEHVVGVEPVGEQLRTVPRNHNQILQVPVAHVGFQGQDHAVFQRLLTGAYEIGLLLMPPGSHPMPDQ